MNGARLERLVIENFRSLRGRVEIPLDGQVVLIHGTNGMGKTSVLSALELGLTGKIAHLASKGAGYQSYLATLNSGGGSISLSATAGSPKGGSLSGSVSFSDQSFLPQPLLNAENSRFFAERCYLPQATLGRLLEIYDDQKVGRESPLTSFVKELLGLDPLDSLVEGLEHASHVMRVRKLVPDVRRLEALKASLEEEDRSKGKAIDDATTASDKRLAILNETLSTIYRGSAVPVATVATDIPGLKAELTAAMETSAKRRADLSRMRSELRGLVERWASLPSQEFSRDRADRERADVAATDALAKWRTTDGKILEEAINLARTTVSDLSPLDDGPEKARLEAQRRAVAEAERCRRLLGIHATAKADAERLNSTVQRASARIEELNKELSGAAHEAKTLANALAGIVPHINDESCPVCNRDYAEVNAGSLSAHVAAKIESLTNEAGRLQILAAARAEESSRLITAQRDLLAVAKGELSSEDLAELTLLEAKMTELALRLSGLASVAANGDKLMVKAADTRDALVAARRRDELSVSLLPEIDAIVQVIFQKSSSNFQSIELALEESLRAVEDQLSQEELVDTARIFADTLLDRRLQDIGQLSALRTERDKTLARLGEVELAFKEIDSTRGKAKKIAEAAQKVRTSIVTKVFNTSLNTVWRDLFVRLAPSEQFVPAFRLPVGNSGKVEAVLETLHRSGISSGSPGAMLSQGNLNTAALTLFLALNLSVPVRMPWLILDDPVQSMDDVHIAQFAALLRSLSKGMDRQVVIAVHERALFDYLTLELSPAFPGDSLTTVEITRDFRGDTVVTPREFKFEIDQAIAA